MLRKYVELVYLITGLAIDDIVFFPSTSQANKENRAIKQRKISGLKTRNKQICKQFGARYVENGKYPILLLKKMHFYFL